MKSNNLVFTAQAAMIAAIYVTLTYVFAPISFSEIQVRISEALTILPVFTPAAIPGLFIGCLIGNMMGGALLPDILFGSLATLIGAFFTWKLRNVRPIPSDPSFLTKRFALARFLAPLADLPLLAPVPPILSNVLIIPFILRYAYMIELPIPLMMLTVGIGEVISCGILGLLLYCALRPYQESLFLVPDKSL